MLAFCSFDILRFVYKHAHGAHIRKVLCLYYLIWILQLGANGYAFVVNHNGFVVFHPRLRLIQV